MTSESQPKPQPLDGEKELDAIQFLGGPKHGKKVADYGYDRVDDLDDVYRRVRLVLQKGNVAISKDFFVYMGKQTDLCIGGKA